MNKNPSLKLYENAHYEKYSGNYFSLPNEIFSLGLDATAIAVFAYLRRLENHRKGDPNRFTCYPSYEEIGKAIHRSNHTVAKYVYELCEKRLIEIESTQIITKNHLKRNGHLRYHILPLEEALRYSYQQQAEKVETQKERKRIAKALAKQTAPKLGQWIPVVRTWAEVKALYVKSHASPKPEESIP